MNKRSEILKRFIESLTSQELSAYNRLYKTGHLSKLTSIDVRKSLQAKLEAISEEWWRG